MSSQPSRSSSSAKVFFIPLVGEASLAALQEKTRRILEAGEFGRLLHRQKLAAIKQHLGEKGNQGFIKPQITKVVVDLIKSKGASPLLVETNTLYRGARANTYDHLMLAYDHGFTIDKVGAPLAILDGINGQNQHPVAVSGKHFTAVNIVSDLAFFDAIFVLTHVKGHMMSGMGGAIKNLAMGFSSRAGKLAQHADFKPEINQTKCIRCEMCGAYCPQDAIRLAEERIEVNLKRCIGCGECFVACRSGAISFRWSQADRVFQEKMAEHALGALKQHKERSFFINYFNHVTQQCDCWSDDNPVRCRDIGIFAGCDPVAVDRACLDTGQKMVGHDIFKSFWPEIDPRIQLEHAEKIGLGSQDYQLVELEG